MSKKVFVLAQFKPKAGKQNELFEVLKALEPDSNREDGCIQYTVTRQIDHPNGMRNDYPIVFNEIWADAEALQAHCGRQQIQAFFQSQVVDEQGLVDDAIVTVYTDEAEHFDHPIYA
ncbi:antibiotic biosynthesis monooxygenase [Vibrio sp.]|nr:antibiotic biosynthesis monooxygenase [Vibrio sp.]